jgi:hypothetical protein
MFELGAAHYWKEKDKEIDFLYDALPVEVKFKSKIGKEDLGHLKYFLRKYGGRLKIRKAFMITKNVEGKHGNIRLIPVWKLWRFRDRVAKLLGLHRPKTGAGVQPRYQMDFSFEANRVSGR